MATKETLFTLPQPLVHLLCDLINIVVDRSVRGGGKLTLI